MLEGVWWFMEVLHPISQCFYDRLFRIIWNSDLNCTLKARLNNSPLVNKCFFHHRKVEIRNGKMIMSFSRQEFSEKLSIHILSLLSFIISFL